MFSDLLNHNPDILEYVGFSMIGSIVLIFATGLSLMLIINFKTIMRKLKLCKLNKKRKAILKKREEDLKPILAFIEFT